MDVSGVNRSGYTPLPVFQDLAVILAARSAVAQLSSQAAVVASATAEEAANATGAASTVSGGSVDLYL